MISADRRFDVAIIGAGVAGVSAALEAAERGARVAVIDAAPRIGGTAALAGGATCIAGTPLQEASGIADSVDLALEDWVRWGGDTVDVEWAERYLLASRPLIFDRLAEAGLRWMSVLWQEGNRVPRWHLAEGGGGEMMRLLEARARTFPRISWMTGHRATELVREAGAITGVRLQSGDREVEVSASAVIVANGGFNNSAELVAEHGRQTVGAERVLLGGGSGARGEGLRMLRAVGAQFTHLDALWIYPYGSPDYRHPESGRGFPVRGIDGDVWVNDHGSRFHDESLRGGATGAKALIEQPNGRCWSVIDARLASQLVIQDPYFSQGPEPIRERVAEFLRDSPFVESAPTIDELARRIDVDAANLRAAVGDLNRALAHGLDRDPEFGKPLAGLRPVEEAPFTAVRFYPMARKNHGGVRTDLACRVLDEDDRPIASLFAAGEVAGMAGGHINGGAGLEGTALGPSMFSGIVAGRSAAA
ncbi:MAG TPA: FAD-dependent oxidoreductase [Microbacteriaceae bacterium]|nr:FAD-dependent oxidoreductase [Microbacteriaceae bacterium]